MAEYEFENLFGERRKRREQDPLKAPRTQVAEAFAPNRQEVGQLPQRFERTIDVIRGERDPAAARPTAQTAFAQPEATQSQQASPFDWLMGEPLSGEEEQFYLASADEGVMNRWKRARDEVLMDLSRRGIPPTSPLAQKSLRDVEIGQAQEMSQNRRNLALFKVQERERRRVLAEQLRQSQEELALRRYGIDKGSEAMLKQLAAQQSASMGGGLGSLFGTLLGAIL